MCARIIIMKFKLKTNYKPIPEQAKAIEKLAKGVASGDKYQVLLGVTGSGKTFTVANVIEKLQRPTLIISHNKTLAAQLYQEMRDLFPDNAVSFFVSYYDYYQPEAYIPSTDTYRLELSQEKIKKVTVINPVSGEEIKDKQNLGNYVLYPAKHFMTDPSKHKGVFEQIRKDLEERVSQLKKKGRELEA